MVTHGARRRVASEQRPELRQAGQVLALTVAATAGSQLTVDVGIRAVAAVAAVVVIIVIVITRPLRHRFSR